MVAVFAHKRLPKAEDEARSEANDVLDGGAVLFGSSTQISGEEWQSFPDGTGAAYMFEFDGAAWVEQTRLVSPDPLPGELDRFD